MKTTFVRAALAAMLGCLALLASAMPALASATNDTVRQPFAVTFSDVNQCSGIPVTATLTGVTVLHTVTQPSGSVSQTVVTSGTLALVPDVAGQPTYSRHVTDIFTGKGRVDPTTGNIEPGTMTSVHNVVLHGSDGSVILVRAVMHETIGPDGTVVVAFDHSGYTCP